ncbi:MAG: SIMPL domain-containing protein [Alistipes sp.]|nr:SIMPL domain-containing protein [Alistipes senegalensis]MCM1251029.1 SIMPL domain-containing protein [Alistipes sp.]
MKKIVLLAVAVAAFASAASAQTQEAYPSYIQVTGRAEKEVVPDEFYLSIVLDERDSKGRISVESQQRDLIATLRRQGVDVEKQLKVANLSSAFFKKNTSVATAKYQLRLGSAAEVAKVWQALDALGISDVSILRVSHSQLEALKEEVRIAAIRNAQQSARTLAEALGQSVGKCFYIWDSNSDIAPAYYNNAVVVRSMKMMDAAGAEAAVEEEPLDFKTIRLQYSVQTKFVLE